LSYTRKNTEFFFLFKHNHLVLKPPLKIPVPIVKFLPVAPFMLPYNRWPALLGGGIFADRHYWGLLTLIPARLALVPARIGRPGWSHRHRCHRRGWYGPSAPTGARCCG